MKYSMKKLSVFTVVCSLSLILTACGGGSSKSSRSYDRSNAAISNDSSSYYDQGDSSYSDADWAELLSLVGGYSNDLSGYGSYDYYDDGSSYGSLGSYDSYYDDSPVSGISREDYADSTDYEIALDNFYYYDNWGTGADYSYDYYDYYAKRGMQKQLEGVCASGQVDVTREANARGSETTLTQFSNCATSGGVINGAIQQSVIGDTSASIGNLNIVTIYSDLSIKNGASKYVLNGELQQTLEWNTTRMQESAISSNLNISAVDAGSSYTFNFTDYNSQTTYDLTANPATYSVTDSYSVYVDAPEFTGNVNLRTEQPLTGYVDGEVISQGRQVISDDSGNQIALKNQSIKYKK